MKYKVLVTDPLSEDGLIPLKSNPNIEIDISTNLTEDELLKKIKTVDALFIRSQTTVTKKILNHAEKLKFIGRAGVGVDNIDLDACTKKGIIVVNAPGGNTNSAAEHTIAMLFSLSRNIPKANASLKNKQWNRSKFIGVEVKHKTLGIIGLGTVGKEVAKRAQGERMTVIGYDPLMNEKEAQQLGIHLCSLEELFKQSDFITIHTPLIEATKHLLDHKAFELMKDGVRIINCARGGIIDEVALLEALNKQKVAGAALDVFEEEPPFSSELLSHPNTVVTPHLGGSTIEAQQNVARYISEDFLRFINNESVLHPVNMPTIRSETMQKMAPFITLTNKLTHLLNSQITESIDSIEVQFSGPIEKDELSIIVRHSLKGILQKYFGAHINEINTLFIAEENNISVYERTTSIRKNELEELTIIVTTSNHEKYSVTGTIIPSLGLRITKMNGYEINMKSEGHYIIIQHKDLPGAIGHVGKILGTYKVNIATMQVDRKSYGEQAMMLLAVDKKPNNQILKELEALEFIDSLNILTFN